MKTSTSISSKLLNTIMKGKIIQVRIRKTIHNKSSSEKNIKHIKVKD